MEKQSKKWLAKSLPILIYLLYVIFLFSKVLIDVSPYWNTWLSEW